MYFFRNQVMKFFGILVDDFHKFEMNLRDHLANDYPNFRFDFSIFEKLLEKEDTALKKMLIVENISEQYCDHTHKIKQAQIKEDVLLWNEYIQNSKPPKGKLPKDYVQRIDLLAQLEDFRCQRCGLNTKSEQSFLNLRKHIEDGGGYNIENLIYCCNDCHRIINSKAPEKLWKDTIFYDRLKMFVRD